MRRPARALILLLALLAPAVALAWGSLDEIRYKIKAGDGNRWGELLGRGDIVRGTELPGTLAFTFDDGPDHRTTPLLLDVLDRHGIKGAFFINGHRISGRNPAGLENQAVLRDLWRRGHFVGNHTQSHKDVTLLDDEGWRLEVKQVEQLVSWVTGRRPWLFRPPFGRADAPAVSHLTQDGYTVVMWNLDPEDWRATTPGDLLARTQALLEEHPDGGVLLMHDTNRNTVQALPLIIEWIEERNAAQAARGERGLEIVGIEHYVRH